MPDFFRSFSKVAGQKQCTTMTYRHQTNDTSERMLQPLTRPIKMYVSDVNQKNEDGYVESLTLAFNTAQYRVRGDTVHGWDPRSTLETTLPLKYTKTRHLDLRIRRYNIQHQYERVERR